MSNQNNRENVNLDSALKEIIKSNKLILELINKPLLSEQKKNLLNSPIFIEKISLIFNFYLKKEKAPVPQSANVNTNANSNSNEREDNIDLKDLEELKKKIKNDNFVQLTPCMDYILLYFADNLNLSFEISYDIMENYFVSRPEEIETIYNMEEVYKSMMNSGENLNDPKYESVYKRYHQVQVDTINNLTKEFYLERVLLLRIYTVLIKSLNDDFLSIKEETRILFKKIFKQENSFIKKFTDLFCSYNPEFKLAKNFDYQEQIEDHSLTIIREQSIILENILLFSLNFQICHTDSFRKLFCFLIDTKYTGYFNYKISDVSSQETRNLLIFYAERIIDYSFLLIIKNMLLGATTSNKTSLLPFNFQSQILSFENNFNEIKDTFLFFSKDNIDFFCEKILKEENNNNLNNSFIIPDENFQGKRISYINKILVLVFYYLAKTIESIKDSRSQIKNDPINQRAINIFTILNNMKIDPENLNKFYNIDESNFQYAINYLNSFIEKEFINEDSQNYNINYPYIIISLSNMIISVKYLNDNNLIFPYASVELRKIIDLLEKIFSNKNILENYWDSLYKEKNDDTLMTLLNKLISQFPINIDLFLKLYFFLLKFNELGEKSNFILTNLLEMKYYTCFIYEGLNKYEFLEDHNDNDNNREENLFENKTINLLEDNYTEILNIPKGTKGILLNNELYENENINQNLDNQYNIEINKPLLVTFFIDFSFYDFIFQKWEMVNDYLAMLKKFGSNDNINIDNINYMENNINFMANENYNKICVDYVRLFCEFISNSTKNIEKYIDSTIKEILVKDDIKKIYVKLINSSFLTLQLIGNDINVYNSLHNLVNAIYRMIISLILNKESSSEFMNIFIAKFILFSSEYEGISLLNPQRNSQADKYNNYNYNSLNKNRFNENLNYSNSNQYPNMQNFNNLQGSINIPELFSYTIKLDKNIKNFENTKIILEFCKLFYQSPIIFNLLNINNAIEFLDVLWKNIVVETAKKFYNFTNISDDQLPLLNEILEIINENINLIYFSSKKSKIISTYSLNNLDKIIISSLNQIDTVKLIMPILKTNIKIQKDFSKKNLFFENILDDIVISDKLNFQDFRYYKRELIKNSLKMLNFIFDKLISWEKIKISQNKILMNIDININPNSIEDNDVIKIYENLNFLKIWHQIFYENKNFVANEIKYENNNYTINLIISLFSYFDFDLVNNYAFSFSNYFCFVSSINHKNLEKYLLQYRDFDDKFSNIGELAIEAINKILYLFNLNGEINAMKNISFNANSNSNMNMNIEDTNRNINYTSTSAFSFNLNLMDYLLVKKESNLSEVNLNLDLKFNLNTSESLISVFETIKYKIFNILESKSYTLKNRILQLFALASNFQTNFFSHLMEITNNRLDEIKFWDIIFKFIEKEKIKIENYQKEKDKKPESIFLLNYCRREICLFLIIFDNIFKHENIYKISIKNLLEKYIDKEFPKFLDISIDLNNSILQCEKIEINSDMEISNYEEFSNNVINEALSIKAISNILSKLILLSASKFYTNTNLLKFDKFQYLYKKFLDKNVGNFLKSFINNSNSNININNLSNNLNDSYINNNDNKLINDLNIILQSNNSKNDYDPNPNSNLNPNIINIKTFLKFFDLTEDNYFLGLLDSLGPLNYNIFHWIDLKEMYILMKIKNYKMEIFFEFFDRLMLYNFYLSQANCQINTIISISYFINLIFSICKSENINSTYLFNGNYAINISKFSEKNLADDIMHKERNNYKKVNFEVFKYIFNNDIDDFLNSITKNFIDLFSEGNEFLQNCHIEGNFFTQYSSYKYNSLFFVLEYLKSFYQLKISGENLSLINNKNLNLAEKKFIENINFHYIAIQNILLNKQLVNLVNEINFYLKSEKSAEVEKCIFSLINLIYGIFSFLVNTNFEIENNKQLEIINYCMKNLWMIYSSNYISNFNNNITLITCAYMNLTNISRSFFKKNNLIDNLIPLLESNINGKKEYQIFKIIMQKFKSDISPSNFLIILKFLINLIKSYDLYALDILITEKIFMNLIINNPLGISLNINEYEDNERGIEHILYCTIWDFMKNILLTISDFEEDNYDSVYFSILEYLKVHEERIYKVLKNTNYKDNVGNFFKKSLGYLEELENITNVLNLLFQKSEKWRHNYPDFYLKILLIILEDTFRLFSPNVKISNHFICHSNYEYKMNEIEYSTEKDIFLNNKIIKDEAASIFSPLKIPKENKIKNQNTGIGIGIDFNLSTNINQRQNLNQNKNQNTLNYFGFNPTIFYYRIDCCLIVILYNLSNIIKKTLVKENQNNEFYFVNYLLENCKPSKVKIIEEHTNNLVYLYFYAIHCYDTNIKNFDMMKNLYNKSQVFFNNTISSNNLGGYNLSYLENDFKDYYFFNMFALQNILNITISYNNILYSSRNNYDYSFPKQLKEITLKKLDFIKILQKRIEDNSKIPELKAYNRANDNLFNFIKTSFEIK